MSYSGWRQGDGGIGGAHVTRERPVLWGGEQGRPHKPAALARRVLKEISRMGAEAATPERGWVHPRKATVNGSATHFGHIDGVAESAPTTVQKNVRILPPIAGRFVRSRSLRPDSVKTYENPAREPACRKTNDFPASVAAALIGPLMTCPRKGLRLWDRKACVCWLSCKG
jgi:hypothetical protein